MSRGMMVSIVVMATLLTGCGDDYLTTQPEDILTDDQVWTDPQAIMGVLADYYDRVPEYMSIDGDFVDFARFDEALYSGITNTDQVNGVFPYPYDMVSIWDYDLIRDINLAIDEISEAESPSLSPEMKAEFTAELRFLRAFSYFEHVKRLGGVPIVTEQQIYDFDGDPSDLQQPRNTEAEVYDFIASEVDAIVDQLGNEGSHTRGNRYTALALKSRAMLYAGSLARHNSEMAAPIGLPDGEVGIPAERAEDYYRGALEAAREIINSGPYTLYRANPDPGENFYEALTLKNGNNEVIWAKDFSASGGLSHSWTLDIIPRSMRVDAVGTTGGAGLSPSLQMVEEFDYLDSSPGVLKGVGDGTAATQDDWIFYDEPDDIFEGKDGRLWGTIIYPGTAARGNLLDLQAGVYIWNESTNQYDKMEGSRDSQYTDDLGRDWTLTGADGPRAVENYVTTTGFYVRKYLDSNPAGATAAVGSDVWWVYFRLGEIYLNAAEAAFELGFEADALGYINALRERAGFPPNSLASLTREDIRNERTVELMFEDHRLWDLRRWRVAHLLWDGSNTSKTANLWSLWPYRIVHPGHPNDGKWVFDKFPSSRQTAPKFFRVGSYYAEIPVDALGNNPKLIANPFH